MVKKLSIRNKSIFNKKNSAVIKMKPVELDIVPPELMSQFAHEALTTASNVFEGVARTQGYVYTIHGPLSEHESKDTFSRIDNTSITKENNLYTEPGQVVHIRPENHTTSLVLSGLKDNTIIIHHKINHVLIRRSENINLDIKGGTLSGVDILHCKRMIVKMPYHNFTNIEFGEGICFQAELNDVSQVHITGSLDIKVNGTTIPINPFVNAMFTKNGCYYKNPQEIPKLMICKY